MRLWSLHPRYLDAPGLVAAWREGLLARAVLRGRTRGYTRHPQLERFRAHASPRLAISAWLAAIADEADARGYAFDRARAGPLRAVEPIAVTRGQLDFEWRHLLAKLAVRDPPRFAALASLRRPACHPLFRACAGPVAPWERAAPSTRDA
ncbi:MAG TPA: pyrimidine dimer DNA glycosylase/endonuclease V [Luteimonas sp.]|nr:pyrimidine dimer DNA glycosylase/endonuclease V [Luteimonas sp.]